MGFSPRYKSAHLLQPHAAEPHPHPDVPVHELLPHPHDGADAVAEGTSLPVVIAALAVLIPSVNRDAVTASAIATAYIALFISHHRQDDGRNSV